MVTDPPYGIELDSEWRDRAGLNGCGPAEPSYLKKRTKGHTETTILGRHTTFVHHQQIIWNKGRTFLRRTHHWFQHEPCWYVWKKNAPWFGKAGDAQSLPSTLSCSSRREPL
jgi:hypothetical protein